MRLLNRDTKELKWFTNDAPPYVVVSHRWHDVETTLQEFTIQRLEKSEKWSQGVSKIMKICEHTASYKEKWIWIDTCCIDKTSSTELQEAINSMYKWYENADNCVIYLEDISYKDHSDPTKTQSLLETSEWFKRGWTLQELIAPSEARFYDADWNVIGDRKDLSSTISTITGISEACFGNRKEILSRTVAERMSWMSKRSTTRVEDMAYCLLGIFDVTIGMLYGEGDKAFQRLQREIVQDLDDETIFLWLKPNATDTVPMLASSPQDFAACSGKKIVLDHFFNREYNVTKRGVRIETCSRRQEQFSTEQNILLNCLIDGERPYVKIRAHGDRSHRRADWKEWVRLASTDFETAAPNSYSIPISELEKFQTTSMDLMRKSHGHDRSSNFGASSRALFDYESEVVAYKVFVL